MINMGLKLHRRELKESRSKELSFHRRMSTFFTFSLYFELNKNTKTDQMSKLDLLLLRGIREKCRPTFTSNIIGLSNLAGWLTGQNFFSLGKAHPVGNIIKYH